MILACPAATGPGIYEIFIALENSFRLKMTLEDVVHTPNNHKKIARCLFPIFYKRQKFTSGGDRTRKRMRINPTQYHCTTRPRNERRMRVVMPRALSTAKNEGSAAKNTGNFRALVTSSSGSDSKNWKRILPAHRESFLMRYVSSKVYSVRWRALLSVGNTVKQAAGGWKIGQQWSRQKRARREVDRLHLLFAAA